jgi:lipopolysaccharide/colanic/teichoic acid biosynthesis glycosyltransferase
MKRVFDIFFSIIALFVFCIPAIIIAVVSRFFEHHPVFYFQIRVGLHKKPYTMIKFQTMVDELPTPFGALLRNTGLDEIPQFINVLKGDMSIVGPRAIRVSDLQKMQWGDDEHAIRWSVRPGITGYAQFYSSHLSEESFQLDKKYIEHHNIAIDFSLICKTFLINIFGKRRILGKQYEVR